MLHDAAAGGVSSTFVLFCLQMRAEKSTCPSWNKFLADVGVAPRKRWITIFAKEVKCIWRSMSARVVPYRQLQPEQLFISATRAQQRVWKNYGIVAPQEVSLYERVANKAQQLWDRIDGKSTCMWLDNVYIKHFVLNPFYSDRSHNATATCLLRTVRLNNFPGHRTLREMRLAIPALAFKIKESFQALKDSIATALTADRSCIRIPLDIVRDVVQRQVWHPFQICGTRCGCTADLLDVLGMVSEVQRHTGKTMPLLIDMKVHNALVRFLYGKDYLHFNFRHFLQHIPIVYGVWHPYKYCLTVTYKKFLPVIAVLLDRELNATQDVPANRRVQFMEKVFAGLLLAWPYVKDLVNNIVQRIRAIAHPTARDRMTLQRVTAVQRLMSSYAPALFVIGHLVRKCTWEGRELGSARHARESLFYCFILLTSISGGDARKVEYIQSVAQGLLCSHPWYWRTCAVIHNEESNESKLSRLGAAWRKHPNVNSLQGTSDLFITIPTPREWSTHARETVPPHFVLFMRISVRRFLSNAANVTTPFLEYKSGKTIKPEAQWNIDWCAPPSLSCNTQNLTKLLYHGLYLITRSTAGRLEHALLQEHGIGRKPRGEVVLDELEYRRIQMHWRNTRDTQRKNSVGRAMAAET